MNLVLALVTESCSEIRKQARELLRGKWKNAMIISLIYSLIGNGIYTLITYVLGSGALGSLVSLLYLLLVTGPISYGYVVCIRKLAKAGGGAEIADLFVGFEKFGKLFLLNLLLGIFIFLWSILLFVPGIIAAIAYSMAYFVMAANDKLKPLDAIIESKDRMKGNKGKFFLLMLSFIGWWLLVCAICMMAALVLGAAGGELTGYSYHSVMENVIDKMIRLFVFLANIVLMPYVYMSTLVFYRLLTGEKDMRPSPAYGPLGASGDISAREINTAQQLQTPEAMRQLNAHVTAQTADTGQTSQTGNVMQTPDTGQTPHIGNVMQTPDTGQTPQTGNVMQTPDTGQTPQTGDVMQTPDTGQTPQTGDVMQTSDTQEAQPPEAPAGSSDTPHNPQL